MRLEVFSCKIKTITQKQLQTDKYRKTSLQAHVLITVMYNYANSNYRRLSCPYHEF